MKKGRAYLCIVSRNGKTPLVHLHRTSGSAAVWRDEEDTETTALKNRALSGFTWTSPVIRVTPNLVKRLAKAIGLEVK